MHRVRALSFSVALACVAVGASPAQDQLQWKQLAPLPDPIGIAAPFSGVSGGALLVAGGANFPGKMPWEGGTKKWHETVRVLDGPNGRWRTAGRLPRSLAYGVSASFRDAVICAGGSDATRHFADTFQLTWKSSVLSISPLPALPIPLANACGARVGDKLYLAGGATEPGEKSASDRAFVLDLAAANARWEEIARLPGKPRQLAIAAATPDAFYVIGGVTLEPDETGKIVRRYLRDAWSYRPGKGWQRLADLPKPVAAAPSPAPIVDGKILVIGGDDGSRAGFQPVEKHPGFPPSILAYDPATDRWSEAGQTPAPRATVPGVEWNGFFVIPSGEVRPGVRSPEVWRIPARR